MLGRKLIVFDSFKGLPQNCEDHTLSVQGHSIEGWFTEGAFSAPLDAVMNNIKTYREIGIDRFFPGWFENAMPNLTSPVLGGFLKFDLASSTKTCLKYLFPKLINRGFYVHKMEIFL